MSPDPAETQVRLPRVQPDASTGPRFPLYAEPTAPAPMAPPPGRGQRKDRRTTALVWVLSLVLLAVLGGVGTWWLIRDDDTAGGNRASDVPSDGRSPQTDDLPGDPSDDPEPSDGQSSDPSQAVDLSSDVEVSAPRPARPGTDLDGSKVRYPASNMLDGDPTTAYRIAGDGTGSEIVFTLDDEATIHEVGLINGYAKVDGRGAGRRDWYASNRKIRAVEWAFDDGSVITQTLRDTTDVQVVPVDAIRSSTVRLRLLAVSKPGPDPRNTTAISTIRIQGTR